MKELREKCPICGSAMKILYKPDRQYHCRKRCGLIVRLQDGESEDYEKVEAMLFGSPQPPQAEEAKRETVEEWEKIDYSTEGSYCLDKCPNGKDAQVGSVACQECDNFKGKVRVKFSSIMCLGKPEPKE